MRSDVLGLAGDVFNLGGKVAGSIPPSGRPGAISFKIGNVVPETALSPAWADMPVVNERGQRIPVRINPDICKSPFVRLFDCVAMVGLKIDELLAMEPGEKVGATFGGQQFVFWVERPNDWLNLIMVDTLERLLKWNPQNLQVADGQHRRKG